MPTRTRSGSQRRTAPRRRLLRSLALAALVAVAAIGLLGTLGTVAVASLYSGDLPSLDSLATTQLKQATRIYDRNGTLIEELYKENRTVVPLAKINPTLREATIATEDRTFYQHQGVDYRRLLIATAYDLTHRTEAYGASTITEQVIKNDVLPDEATMKSLDRKLKEALLAEELERRYSKDQILELYLNSIPYGNGAFGAEAAAETYFGVHASELNLAQASFLAGLPQSPGVYNPFGTAAEQAAAKQRWREVLDSLVAAHYVKPAEADQLFATDLMKQMQDHRKAAATGRDPVTAHFADYVRSYLLARYGERSVYEGGLQVYTSLDLPTQRLADQAVKKGVAEYGYKGANTGALLAMDPRDGEIIAMVGSADYNNDAIRGQVNLTGVDPSGYRPVGSSFKPYTYGAALETGALTAATPVDDAHDVIDGHQYFDWDSKKEGMIPLRQALQESRNLPALWTYKAEGGAAVVAYAQKLGITARFSSPDSIPTTLGTESMSMVEHLSAYSAFDNGGYRVTPHPVLKVVDGSGQVLESFDRQPSRQQVLKPEEAYLMTDLLRGPPRIYLGMGNRPVAAKSGTTESWTGAYWIGYTPDLAVATYMAHVDAGDACKSGFASLAQGFQPSGWLCPTNVLWGEHVGISVWKPFLDAYYATHPWPAAWTAPAGIVHHTVCKADGNLASDKLPADQKFDEIFIQGVGEPTKYCAGDPGAPGATPSPSPSAAPAAGGTPRPSPGATIVPVTSTPTPTPTPTPAPKR
jgi:membrane peptidoglycan carboxypeptidase